VPSVLPFELGRRAYRCKVRPGLGRESKRPLVQGRKVDPSAVPPTFGNAALLADVGSTLRVDLNRRFATISQSGDSRIGAALYRWRSAPEPTGEPWKLAVWSGGSRGHSLSSPHQLAPTAGSLRRRREVLVPITARIRMWRESTGTAASVSNAGRLGCALSAQVPSGRAREISGSRRRTAGLRWRRVCARRCGRSPWPCGLGS
jgi:hypothetical protein